MEQFEKGPEIENPEEHIEAIRRIIAEAGIAEGSRVVIRTKSHPNPKSGIIRSMQLEEQEPSLNVDLAPMRNVQVDLKNIISIEIEKWEA